jgi:hypothetical protein
MDASNASQVQKDYININDYAFYPSIFSDIFSFTY